MRGHRVPTKKKDEKTLEEAQSEEPKSRALPGEDPAQTEARLANEKYCAMVTEKALHLLRAMDAMDPETEAALLDGSNIKALIDLFNTQNWGGQMSALRVSRYRPQCWANAPFGVEPIVCVRFPAGCGSIVRTVESCHWRWRWWPEAHGWPLAIRGRSTEQQDKRPCAPCYRALPARANRNPTAGP